MFCPECKCEYRVGFTHCSDCDVDLVESLEEDDAEADGGVDSDLREVWQGTSAEECGLLTDSLNAAQVPFQLIQSKDELFGGIDQSFRIVVPEEVAAHAETLIAELLTELEQPSAPMELPAEDDADDEVASRPRRPRGPWHSEDATAEVASGESDKTADMIEASLRENGIRVRIETSDGGAHAAFVVPEDESRAREIILEIKDATPRG